MLNQKNIRQTIRKPFIEGGVIGIECVAWENRKFNSDNREIWCRETLLPVGEERICQGVESYTGIYVIDVFVKSSSGTEQAEEMVNDIGELYNIDNLPYIQGDGVRCVVDSVQSVKRQGSGKWEFIPIHINFTAFKDSQ